MRPVEIDKNLQNAAAQFAHIIDHVKSIQRSNRMMEIESENRQPPVNTLVNWSKVKC